MKIIKTILILFMLLGTVMAKEPPTDCVSMTGFYPRAPESVTYYSFTNKREYFYGYIPYFRVFIPPGSVIMDMTILEASNQSATLRHKIPPTGGLNYAPRNYFTLAEAELGNQLALENLQGYLFIAHDSFLPYLDESRAGWLYIKVDGGGYSQIYDNNFSVRVDTKAYNKWWDNNIKNEAGWNTRVQNVETYIPTPCEIASLDDKFVLNLPYLVFNNEVYKVNFVYEFDPIFIVFKFVNIEKVEDNNCAKSTLSETLKLSIPNLKMYNNKNVSVDLQYDATLSNDGIIKFIVTNYKEM